MSLPKFSAQNATPSGMPGLTFKRRGAERRSEWYRCEPCFPEKAMVVATGDGAFGFNEIEVDTAVRHEATVPIVIANNGA